MTLTVTLSDEQQANIAAKASARGVSVDALVEEAVLDLASAPPADKPGERSKIKRVPMKDRREEIRWIEEHRAEYAGKWVALDGSNLVAVGDDLKPVLEAARKAGIDEPFVDQVFPPGAYLGSW